MDFLVGRFFGTLVYHNQYFGTKYRCYGFGVQVEKFMLPFTCMSSPYHGHTITSWKMEDVSFTIRSDHCAVWINYIYYDRHHPMLMRRPWRITGLRRITVLKLGIWHCTKLIGSPSQTYFVDLFELVWQFCWSPLPTFPNSMTFSQPCQMLLNFLYCLAILLTFLR